MAISAFKSTTKREFRSSSEGIGHRRGSSHSDSSSRFFSESGSVLDNGSFHDASSQRDSDQDSLYRDDAGAANRHLTSDSESESSSIIDRFRLTSNRTGNTATIPRFQQSTISARGRQRSIEPQHRRSESREPVGRSGRSDSREPVGRRGESREPVSRTRRSDSREPVGRAGRNESREPVGRAGRNESREPVRAGRSESREPVGRAESREPVSRAGRSESREPGYRRSESREPLYRRSESREPVYGGSESRDSVLRRRSESKEPVRNRRSESQEPELVVLEAETLQPEFEERRGRTTQRGEVTFTSSQGVRPKRSESQEPRGRSHSKEPVHGRHRRSESQGPGPQRYGALKHLENFRLSITEPPVSDGQEEERTIRAVHAQLKPTDPPAGDGGTVNLYGAMRAEVRKAVADLKSEIEQSLEKDVLTLVKAKGELTDTELRQQYTEKLEESENRTKELISQLVKEEEARLELANLVNISTNRPKTRSASQERKNISKTLDEEAQKFFEEFASISASENEEIMDRRQSRTSKGSSSRNRKSPARSRRSPSKSPSRTRSVGLPRWKTGYVAVNADGVVTPWLDWETDSADVRSFLVLDDVLTQLSQFQDTISAGIDWDSVAFTNVAGDDSILASEDLSMQRLRFQEWIEGGRVHLCRTEF